jgi:hypothetical protein
MLRRGWTIGLISLAVAAAALAATQIGLVLHEPEAWTGYTLMAPIALPTTYLLDMEGNVVHTWVSDAPAGNAALLLPSGNLLRTEQVVPESGRMFDRGGAGGRVREIAPDGTIVWEFVLSTSERRLHHDVTSLPNGDVLLIAWEAKTAAEAVAAGRDPSLLKDGELWPDSILEVRPTPPVGGEIVWEWHVWDHLVQDFDSARPNYGNVAAHPELVDLNNAAPGGPADWNHTNSVAYNEDLDQIVVSVHEWSEVWILDHSTTTAEAAGHTGGRLGRGGDLLYRWGNPQAYGAGGPRDQVLFGQHDAQWISDGLPGEGHLLLFNNGLGRTGANYSTVDEIALPLLGDGTYAQPSAGEPYLPSRLSWTYRGSDFYSPNISGAQRLPNGDTLICEGASGHLFEVTSSGNVVWSYLSPYSAAGPRGPRNEVFKVRRYAPDDPAIAALGS